MTQILHSCGAGRRRAAEGPSPFVAGLLVCWYDEARRNREPQADVVPSDPSPRRVLTIFSRERLPMASDERNPPIAPPSYSTMRGKAKEPSISHSKMAASTALEDEKLLHLIAKGDRSALEVLYDRYAGGIYSLAHHMLQERGAAEEVTQDTFFNVWRRASSYNAKRGKVSGWLFSIGHHRIIDELRKRRRQESMIYVPDVEAVHRQEDESADPNEYVEQRVQGNRIRKALDTLRPELKSVVVLAYYGGLTQSEIAKKLNQPLGTVKTRTRLALKTLRENLGPQARKWLDG